MAFIKVANRAMIKNPEFFSQKPIFEKLSNLMLTFLFPND